MSSLETSIHPNYLAQKLKLSSMAASESSSDALQKPQEPMPTQTWLGGILHRYFLGFLVGVYALAAFLPGPGRAIRNITFAQPTGGEVHAPMLLLAMLLFCAAAVIRWSEIRDLLERPSVLLLGLLAAWFGPALFVAIIGPVLPKVFSVESTAGIVVGLALVAAMPVANSSAGWSQNAGGNIALSLGLIVLSIVLSPLAAPQMLKLMGFALSEADTEKIEQLVARFSGLEFILWVVLPSLAGALFAWAAGENRIARLKPWIRLITLFDLLVLNYANAALAMPKLVQEETLATAALPAVLAILLGAVGIVIALGLARLCGLPRASRTTMLFALSMKHTGLALVLAGEVLAEDHPRVILAIVLATLLQHLVAAAIDWRLQRSGGSAHVET
ncbi:bile acid:sodium symporter family protein [Adhaeretor mobilis]|uniref:Sodium Bile acid symporter family protein n=1 Tax=Adhaeretor mobilis TaxID=1930276 RepID=A0A517N0J7_9BACT|nr:bile acid:sodium symporter [Adhaeretor mobilis]QDT00656.1 Sodium Bile acid symporter family protein [Adhaeretor mobilis]